VSVLCIAHNQVVLSLSRSESITNYANEAGKLHESIFDGENQFVSYANHAFTAPRTNGKSRKSVAYVSRGRSVYSRGTFIDHNIHARVKKSYTV